MRQTTLPEQTAKLIELGFEKPKFEIETQLCNIKGQPLRAATIVGDYSIGELLSFLPLTILWTPRVIRGNAVEYSFETEGSELYCCNVHNELIDNLFDMCVLLKKEGVI